MRNYRRFRIFMPIVLLIAVLFISVSCKTKQEEVKAHPVLLEIIGEVPGDALLEFLSSHDIGASQVYEWSNRYLIYDIPAENEAMLKELSVEYPAIQTKIYSDPFYVFDRTRCNDEPICGALAYKVLTANLVSDPALQQEYMDYHETQFEEWPEVGAGFCRAEFQELLVYRNGRQLMLIISYPAGKDYDTLNARTMENNPRVDEWNAIMGKYQEGVEGTEQDETWVFFEPI